MAKYSEIERHVREIYGFTVKPCWIAHVKADHGLTTRQAYNRTDPTNRQHPCPPAKRAAIEDSMRHFGEI
jgi:hypothetical protein